jgi:hypothetical protein
MSHGAIENLPPEPTTPSISSVSSELSFESDIVAMPTRLPKESEGGPKQHPTLFIRDDMVTILVRYFIRSMSRRADIEFAGRGYALPYPFLFPHQALVTFDRYP